MQTVHSKTSQKSQTADCTHRQFWITINLEWYVLKMNCTDIRQTTENTSLNLVSVQ